MNIFISYSVADTNTVRQIADHLRGHGVVRYWAESKEPGKGSWPTIFSWIDSADLVFVVITGATLRRAMSVGQEVVRARTLNKFIVPLVESGIPTAELGCLHGLAYIELDPAQPSGALDQARHAVERRKIEKDQAAKVLLAIGALVALLCIASD